MNTKNSTEYQILKYLNDHNFDYNITTDFLSRVLTNVTTHEIETALPKLTSQNYVGYKTEREKGLTITEQGQKRHSKMQTDVDIESGKNKSNDDMNNIFSGQTNLKIYTICISAAIACFLGGMGLQEKIRSNQLETAKSKIDQLRDSVTTLQKQIP